MPSEELGESLPPAPSPSPAYPWTVEPPAPRPEEKKRDIPIMLVLCIAGVLISAAVMAPLAMILSGVLDDGPVGGEDVPPLVLLPADGTAFINTVPELSWVSLHDADKYRIQIATDPDFGNVLVNVVTDSTTYRPDGQALGNATYYWRVAAYADGAWDEWSEASTFIVSPPWLSVTYSWIFYADGSSWTVGLNVSAEDYYEARSEARGIISSPYAFARYVTPYDPAVLGMAEELKAMAEGQGYDVYTTACFVLSFVQSMTYDSDLNTTGYEEYPRYPVETIVNGTGDCEDTAALFASLVQSSCFGMDAVLVYLQSEGSPVAHLAVGLYLRSADVPNEVHFTHENVTSAMSKARMLGWENGSHQFYYYCEATTAVPIGWPTEAAYWDPVLIPC